MITALFSYERVATLQKYRHSDTICTTSSNVDTSTSYAEAAVIDQPVHLVTTALVDSGSARDRGGGGTPMESPAGG